MTRRGPLTASFRPLSSMMLPRNAVHGLSKRTHLTGRGIVRLVRIARTIADVAESEQVTQDHVLEAAIYQGRRDQ